jgi:outer membrane protein
MTKIGAAAFAPFAALSLRAPARAAVVDNFQVKVGVSGLLPDENGDPIDVRRRQ